MKKKNLKMSDNDLMFYTEAIFDFPAHHNSMPLELDYSYDFGRDTDYDSCTSYAKGYRVRRIKDLLRNERPFWATC